MNREVMMQNLIAAVRTVITKPFETHVEAVNCHHNYVQKEHHFGKDVLVSVKAQYRRTLSMSWELSRGRWAPKASSCAEKETRTASTAVATVPDVP
ncbi:RtcB family protein [Massilia sp. B-10]|nr:RtcB family protein [Massilia sp. B-10]